MENLNFNSFKRQQKKLFLTWKLSFKSGEIVNLDLELPFNFSFDDGDIIKLLKINWFDVSKICFKSTVLNPREEWIMIPEYIKVTKKIIKNNVDRIIYH